MKIIDEITTIINSNNFLRELFDIIGKGAFYVLAFIGFITLLICFAPFCFLFLITLGLIWLYETIEFAIKNAISRHNEK